MRKIFRFSYILHKRRLTNGSRGNDIICIQHYGLCVRQCRRHRLQNDNGNNFITVNNGVNVNSCGQVKSHVDGMKTKLDRIPSAAGGSLRL